MWDLQSSTEPAPTTPGRRPVRGEHEHTLGIAQDGHVRVVRDEDQLAPALDLADAVDDRSVDEAVIEIVLGLVDQQRVLAVQQ